MPVRIRLMRMGMKKRPFYRIVVANSAGKRDGRFIEQVGYYDPMTDPSTIKVDEEIALKWLRVGAQPTETVSSILKKQGVLRRFREEKSGAAAPAAEPAAAGSE